ncbi:MAG: ABC transporter substrate-binding protein [Mariprofundaceae bacterium]
MRISALSRLARHASQQSHLHVLVLLVSFFWAGEASAKEVAVLLDSHVRPYVEALVGFQQVSKASIKIYERSEDGDASDELALVESIRTRSPDHILVLGEESMLAIAGKVTDIPVLYCMVLNPEEKLSQDMHNLTGVSMNVPPDKQMEVLSLLVPSAKKIGVLYDPEEVEHFIQAGRVATTKYRLQLEAQAVSSSIQAVQEAKAMMSRIDAFWMVPDRTVTTIDLVKYLLFNARKQGIPLIGVSEKYVRAGSLFAFTAENEALGRQAAEMSNLLLNGSGPRDLPPQMARDVKLSINSKVAKSLGLVIPQRLLNEASRVY